jgi:sodium/potassium/calcium exchanger 5
MTDDDDDDDDEPVNPFQMPTKKLMKVVHIILFPISLLFFLTIPDSRRPFFRKFPLYFLSFIMSTVYLGVLTYLLVWMVVVVAYTLDIPDTVAGLTILAAGTSVPEVVSGIIVTRKVNLLYRLLVYLIW